MFLNERCWKLDVITNTSLTNLRNFVSKCVFFSIGSRPSSLFECLIWIRDECRFGATVLITSQRHICTVEPVQLFACVQGQGHESCRTGSRRDSEMKRWKVDRNTDAKFLGSLLCSYCNLFVLNVAERCVVIPSLW